MGEAPDHGKAASVAKDFSKSKRHENTKPS